MIHVCLFDTSISEIWEHRFSELQDAIPQKASSCSEVHYRHDNFNHKTLIGVVRMKKRLHMESSRVTDSSIVSGGETDTTLKEKIEWLEVELEELKNINDLNDDIL